MKRWNAKSGMTGKGYDPNRFIDMVLVNQNMKCDAELARALAVNPSVISKLRRGKTRVSASLLLGIHEMTKMSIRELRNLIGDTKNKYFPFRQSSFN
ncbi:MAG: helix-turn-helix transcriptional regulator [Burkholderiaceae bacterium]|jgi:transcriptional regulator with XRE-family HTH domain|nr:helix-turn-helix transcriptional regulator [Burkholderiaceae bacterium]